MTILYNQLAEIYEAMYHSFIDYQDEYQFYSGILESKNYKEVLEIGCGSGNLASKFLSNNWRYHGLDFSENMLDIARSKNPSGKFSQGDMRAFTLSHKVQSAIITGRTISYLLTNEDVIEAFRAIHNNLDDDGILVFDFIDASRYIPTIAKDGHITHNATHKDIEYKRESLWTPNFKFGMDMIWDAKYYKKSEGSFQLIGEDRSSARAFTLDEIKIFLSISGYTLLDVIDRDSYAFPTYVIVALRG